MRVIKYFFEEPTLLEDPVDSPGGVASGKRSPSKRRHYRGYLAASDLEAGTMGGSSLEDQAAAKVLARIFTGPIWFSNRAASQPDVSLSLLTDARDIVRALSTMGIGSVMMMDVDPTQEVVRALNDDMDHKGGMQMIAQLLDGGCTLIFPERAQMGHDWSVFSQRPIADEMREAMCFLPEDTRGFVIPYVEARGGDKFYFEQSNIDLFARHEVR